MGQVYRATDTRLGRDVALKVLPPEMAGDPDRLARFQREARAVAALNHPNVVTVYSVEEADGVHFITMELIEGHPLDHLIAAKGLPADRIIEMAGAIAEGLAAAHEKGIVHRDLKPANVMVTTDGRVKVLDFGLAKDVGAESATNATLTSAGQTQAGVVMGTPTYMSPEQVSGRPLDHRSDIFSFGVVLHEMATGRRPFGGNSSAELISSILRDTPPAVTESRPELPPDLARVIRRCLEKDPRYRMQTARDVSNEFRDLARSAARATPIASSATPVAAPDSGPAKTDEGFWVAVLPFKYSSANADLAALAEGLSDEIVTGLSRFSYLRVIARSSTARYAGQPVDVRSAGKELSARYVMEGTLRQAGAKVRIAVQLVDAQIGSHLWAENYERAFASEALFELQDDLVPRIVSTIADMNGVLPMSMSQVLRGRAPEQMSPYEAVLSSFAYCYSATPEALTAARTGLEEAVRKSPTYSDAWAMLSFLCGQDYVHGYELQANALEVAASAARRAVELGPSNHLAYFSLGQALWCQKDYDSFRDALERAVALNPMDGNSVAYLGELLTYTGSAERGMQLVERAKQLNPNHPGWYWFADFYHAFSQGDYHGAQSFALKAKLRGNPLAPMFLAAARGQIGDLDSAARAVADLVKFRPELPALMRKQVAKVWNPEYGERFLDGLRKAGMEIPDTDSAAGKKSSGISTTNRSLPDSGAARADEGFWIAVLPFKYSGTNKELTALAEGLSEEVITGLSRFSYLRVIARGSTAKYSNESGDVRTIGNELGARYVMEGTLRHAGATLRIAVQLVDAATGAHLWAQTYERTFRTEDVFAVQDDITDRVVATVADANGVLVRSMAAAVEAKPEATLTALDWMLSCFGYRRNVTSESHARLREGLEHFVEREPNHADAWACLALIYCDEFSFGFNPRPDALGRSLAAARRSIKIDGTCQNGNNMLAQVHFYRRDVAAFRAAAEDAIALNPRNTEVLAQTALLLVFGREGERGTKLARRAMDMNPQHPGWYHVPLVWDHFQKGEYEQALEQESRINIPGLFWQPLAVAACCGMLDRRAEAAAAAEELRRLDKDIELHLWRYIETYNYASGFMDRILEGLAKAGLHVVVPSGARGELEKSGQPKSGVETAAPSSRTPSSIAMPAQTPSGDVRTDEGFWVAVLPFKYVGGSADLTALAEGLTDDIVTNMSKFSYLRVIARSSTAQYAQRTVDVRTVAKEVGARYVMEGSIRQAGTKIRIATQLLDASTGASLWAETYDRSYSPEAMLDLLDDVVPRIVATVGDTQGVLALSMTDALRNRDPDSLTPYEAVLRSFGHYQRVNAAEHLAARTVLEHAVKQPPDRGDCWASLALLYREEYTHGFNLQPDPLGRALAASRRALDAAPANHLAHAAMASTLFFQGDLAGFRAAAERAIALNPLEGYTSAYLGMLMAYSGDWARGCALAERAMQLNPNHPGWYWFPRVFDAYRQRDYPRALEMALKVNLPGFWRTQLVLAAANGQLGERVAAGNAAQALLKIRPNFAVIARDELRKWYNNELTEHLIEGLSKAGLEIPDAPKIPPSRLVSD